MVYVLKCKYVYGTDPVLDIISEGEFRDQDDLADKCGVSTSTLDRWIARYKQGKLLWISRDINKNIYYLLGSDAEKRWTAKECKEKLNYRAHEEVLDAHVSFTGSGNAKSLDLSKYPDIEEEEVGRITNEKL